MDRWDLNQWTALAEPEITHLPRQPCYSGQHVPSLSWWQVVSEQHGAPVDVVGVSQASQPGRLLQLIMANSRFTNTNIHHVLTEHCSAQIAQRRQGQTSLSCFSNVICVIQNLLSLLQSGQHLTPVLWTNLPARWNIGQAAKSISDAAVDIQYSTFLPDWCQSNVYS